MANDFSSDTNCVALWRFENGALTTDSKGSNTLTASPSPPTSDTTNYREGSGSALYTKSNSQYHYITDANLSSGFPTKTGDANKLISVCFWYYSGSFTQTTGHMLVTKWATGKKSWAIQHYYSFSHYIYAYVSSNGTDQEQFGTPADAVTSNTWYHVGLVIDGVNKTGKIRLWNGSTATNYTHNLDNELYISDAGIYLGQYQNLGATYYHNGNLDEVVIFDKLLADNEIDAIRLGTYPSTLIQFQTSSTLSLSETITKLLEPGSIEPTDSIYILESVSTSITSQDTSLQQSADESVSFLDNLLITLSSQKIPVALQMGFSVRDSNGKAYTYGGIDLGYIERLENGTTFDGANIVSHFRTRDIPIGQWQYQAQVRKVKHMAVAKSTTTQDVEITHYGDASYTPTANKNDNKPSSILCPVRDLTSRVTRKIESVGWGDFNFHAFDCVVSTDDELVAYEPLGLAIRYKVIREEMI